MIIATFNSNSLRARIPIVIQWLNTHQPDILAVQETKVQDMDFPIEDFRQIGYYPVFKGQKSYNGVAILSRSPLDDVRIGFHDGDEINGPRLIRGVYQGITIINTYVPQGRDRESEFYQTKLQWLRDLNALFTREYSPDDPIVWLGDLNVAPEAIDVYDPDHLEGHVCFNRELTACFYDVCAWGFHDVFRKHHPEAGHFTFFDYRMRGSVSRNHGWRIDHILATKPVIDRSSRTWIDLEPRKSKEPKPSDHTFLIAEFV